MYNNIFITYSDMSMKYLTIMLMMSGLIVSACSNKLKSYGSDVESDSIESDSIARVTQRLDSIDAEYYVKERSIESIRRVWADKKIKVDADPATLGISQLALAFCQTYPQCDTNEALRRYLVAPHTDGKDLDSLSFKSPTYKHTFTYWIEPALKNGYIRSMGEVQVGRTTFVCFWNRKNGHKLFAAFMEECWEASTWEECLVVFYDYDPATGVMSPEPALTNLIEKRMRDYDAYSVVLPKEGKDIMVIGYIYGDEEEEEGEDNFEDVELNLKWNGMTFNWEN